MSKTDKNKINIFANTTPKKGSLDKDSEPPLDVDLGMGSKGDKEEIIHNNKSSIKEIFINSRIELGKYSHTCKKIDSEKTKIFLSLKQLQECDIELLEKAIQPKKQRIKEEETPKTEPSNQGTETTVKQTPDKTTQKNIEAQTTKSKKEINHSNKKPKVKFSKIQKKKFFKLINIVIITVFILSNLINLVLQAQLITHFHEQKKNVIGISKKVIELIQHKDNEKKKQQKERTIEPKDNENSSQIQKPLQEKTEAPKQEIKPSTKPQKKNTVKQNIKQAVPKQSISNQQKNTTQQQATPKPQEVKEDATEKVELIEQRVDTSFDYEKQKENQFKEIKLEEQPIGNKYALLSSGKEYTYQEHNVIQPKETIEDKFAKAKNNKKGNYNYSELFNRDTKNKRSDFTY